VVVVVEDGAGASVVDDVGVAVVSLEEDGVDVAVGATNTVLVAESPEELGDVAVAAAVRGLVPGVRRGEGRVVTSLRTLPTAEVAKAIEIAVAANQARAGPILRLIPSS